MKFYLSFLFLALFTFSYGQGLQLSEEEVQLELDGYLEYGDVLITNTDSENVEVAVRLEVECYEEGDITKIQICIGTLCFFPTDEETVWGDDGGDPILVLEPDTPSDALKFSPIPVGEVGSSWNVVFYDRNDPANSATLNVKIAACTPVSTKEIVHEVGAAFPNPAKDIITIPYQHDAENAQLQVFNTLGVLVQSAVLDRYNGQLDLDVSALHEGLYFYYIIDEKGGQSQVLSFVK